MGTSKRRTLQVALVIAVGFAVVANARAEQEGDHEGLLRQGVQLRREGKDVEALAAFKSAFRIRPTPRAQAQIGLAEQALGHWPEADSDLGAALDAKNDPWIAKNSESLSSALAKVRRHLGQLQVLGSPAGAKVSVDNREIGQLPMSKPARVPSGEVVLSVSAPGHISIARKIMVGSSQEIARETIVLHSLQGMAAGQTDFPATGAGGAAVGEPGPSNAVTSAAGPPVGPDAPTSSPERSDVDGNGRPWQLTAGGVGLGVGALLLAGAITAHVLSDASNQEFNNIKNAPNASGLCSDTAPDRGGGKCEELWNSANLRLRLAIGGYVLSGLTLAGSLYLLLSAPSGGEGQRKVAGACLPGGGGGSLSCSLAVRF